MLAAPPPTSAPVIMEPGTPQVPPAAVEPPDPLDALRSLSPPLAPSDAQGGEQGKKKFAGTEVNTKSIIGSAGSRNEK